MEFNSGASAARRAAKRSPIFIWERKGNPSMNFLIVTMASGIALERVRRGDREGVTQDGGQTPNNRLTETCSLGLPFTSLILDNFVMVN